ncbi:hypothetical protein O181_065320 [Austropuccinia psidii MF-1]|uniref:Uncharacterized protein n=1 Tax=Austropuccinia psidii MF-1 TaxID=1389203 RepID=A0A9Q3EUV4_9BASI|nr:hypothetical protein [Austropuccinia psidii MF-1]
MSQPSEPHEDTLTCEPEPEVAPTQSTDEPFGKSPLDLFDSYQLFSRLVCPSPACPTTPSFIIITDDMPVGSPSIPTQVPSPVIPTAFSPVGTSSPHSHDEAQQEFTELLPALMIPRAIVHKEINQILFEHCQLLHMIPVVDVPHQNEMHREFCEELNYLFGQALEAYSKEEITGIVSRFLEKKSVSFSLFTACNTLL